MKLLSDTAHDKMQITLYLTRHGKTEYNTHHIINGHLNSPLIPDGIESSKQCGKYLHNLHFDRVYVSDLGRTLQTLHYMGLAPGIKEPRLRDRNFGGYNGKAYKLYSQAKKAHSCKVKNGLVNGHVQNGHVQNGHAQPGPSSYSERNLQEIELPGVERYYEVEGRITSLIHDMIQDLLKNHAGDSANVLFVTHCSPARVCAMVLEPFCKARFNLDLRTCAVPNNSITEYHIRVEPDSGVIEGVECVRLFSSKHLPALQ